MWMTAENPHLVDRLIVVDAVPFLPALRNPEMSEQKARSAFVQYKDYYVHLDSAEIRATQNMVLQGMIADEKARRRVLETSILSDPKTMGITMYELLTRDLRDEIVKIRIPVQLITSWDESMDSMNGLTRKQKIGMYKQQYRGIESIQIHCIDNARHFVMLDQPEHFVKTVDGFLTAEIGQ